MKNDMEHVNTYNENNWFLTHDWYVDDFGMKKNCMQLYKIGDDGIKTIYPFHAPIRVRNYDKSSVLDGDDVSPYETFEYADMLREQVEKIQKFTYGASTDYINYED